MQIFIDRTTVPRRCSTVSTLNYSFRCRGQMTDIRTKQCHLHFVYFVRILIYISFRMGSRGFLILRQHMLLINYLKWFMIILDTFPRECVIEVSISNLFHYGISLRWSSTFHTCLLRQIYV